MGAIYKWTKFGLIRIQVLYHLCQSHVKMCVIQSGSCISENIRFGPPVWTQPVMEEGCAHQALLQNHPIMMDLKRFQNPQSDLQGGLRIGLSRLPQSGAPNLAIMCAAKYLSLGIFAPRSVRMRYACVQLSFHRQISMTLRRRNRNELYGT